MAEARCLAVARRLAAQVPQDGLAEKTWKQSNAHSHSSSHGTSSKPFCLILRPFSVVIAAIVLETSHAIVCEESVRPCETLGVSYSLEV